MRLFRRKQDERGVPSLTAQDLKRRLDGGENLAVVDVRQPTGYKEARHETTHDCPCR